MIQMPDKITSEWEQVRQPKLTGLETEAMISENAPCRRGIFVAVSSQECRSKSLHRVDKSSENVAKLKTWEGQ
jgi:hypothetical protein